MPLEPAYLMILPACLILVGMITGFAIWSWTRGVDAVTIDELQDEIRQLGRIVQQGTSQAELLDLQFENEELRIQAESLLTTQRVCQLEIEELRSAILVHESENQLAEQTIRDLRSRAEAVPSKPMFSAVNRDSKTYAFVDHRVLDTRPAAIPDRPTTPHSQPRIIRAEFNAPPANPDAEYGGVVHQDEQLGLVYSRPPLVNDNLQLISGIASKLENQLNDHGVFTFRQIMLWNQTNIEQFSNLLGTFQDRIQRDDWVGQATRLNSKARQVRKAA